MDKQKIERTLNGFTGTEEYHRWSVLFRDVMTDGVKYMAESCGAYWLLDIVASYQQEKKFRSEQHFQVWKLKKNADDSAVVTAEDGNKHVLATQEIEMTDFPLDEIKLYYIDGVILLPSEY